jgi:oligopeptide/dipeptide ABC transporter ATP-binding protein
MKELQRERQMSIILITHDLGVVAQMADDVAVMYAGQVVENGPVDSIFYHPAHPYTLGLRAAMPEGDEKDKARLVPIDGAPPDLFSPPVGCAYYDRCPAAMKVCQSQNPPLWQVEGGHSSRCWLHHQLATRPTSGPVAHLYRGAQMGARP